MWLVAADCGERVKSAPRELDPVSTREERGQRLTQRGQSNSEPVWQRRIPAGPRKAQITPMCTRGEQRTGIHQGELEVQGVQIYPGLSHRCSNCSFRRVALVSSILPMEAVIDFSLDGFVYCWLSQRLVTTKLDTATCVRYMISYKIQIFNCVLSMQYMEKYDDIYLKMPTGILTICSIKKCHVFLLYLQTLLM